MKLDTLYIYGFGLLAYFLITLPIGALIGRVTKSLEKET